MTGDTITVGSLCSGIGGLELALDLAGIRTDVRWLAEIADAPSAILAQHFPDVPNLGDWTAIQPEPVDLIVGGLPCQPVSQAGQRAGTDDERWLFDDLFRIVGRMEPRPVVFFENVFGLLSANHGNAMARVVHGLSEIGYLGAYGILRASDVGACHHRARWFCMAWPADSISVGRITRAGFGQGEPSRLRRHGPGDDSGTDAADTDGETPDIHGTAERSEPPIWHGPGDDSRTDAADTDRGQRTARQGFRPDAGNRPADSPIGNGPDAADSDSRGRVTGPRPGTTSPRRPTISRVGSRKDDHRSAIPADETGRLAAAADTDSDGQHRSTVIHREPIESGQQLEARYDADGLVLDGDRQGDHRSGQPVLRSSSDDFGPYTAAVRRWELILARPAPSPTIPVAGQPDGLTNGRLNPAFVEWMMGYPAGWTATAGSKAARLKMLGNAVVPQQAAAALRLLLEDI